MNQPTNHRATHCRKGFPWTHIQDTLIQFAFVGKESVRPILILHIDLLSRSDPSIYSILLFLGLFYIFSSTLFCSDLLFNSFAMKYFRLCYAYKTGSQVLQPHKNDVGLHSLSSGIAIIYKKCKAIPVTGREDPEGCEISRLPHFLSNRFTDGGKVLILTHRLPFIPQKIPGSHFCYRLSRP
jgi:hypothetical protein